MKFKEKKNVFQVYVVHIFQRTNMWRVCEYNFVLIVYNFK